MSIWTCERARRVPALPFPCEEAAADSKTVGAPVLRRETGAVMPVFRISRFAVRPDARGDVEQAMRDFALYVGLELEDSSWTTYRDRRNPNCYVTVVTAEDVDAAEHQRTTGGSVQYARVLATRLLTDVETREYELVATSRGGLPP